MNETLKGEQLARIFYKMPRREKKVFFSQITKNADYDLLDMIDSEIINNRIEESLMSYEEYAEQRLKSGR